MLSVNSVPIIGNVQYCKALVSVPNPGLLVGLYLTDQCFPTFLRCIVWLRVRQYAEVQYGKDVSLNQAATYGCTKERNRWSDANFRIPEGKYVYINRGSFIN